MKIVLLAMDSMSSSVICRELIQRHAGIISEVMVFPSTGFGKRGDAGTGISLAGKASPGFVLYKALESVAYPIAFRKEAVSALAKRAGVNVKRFSSVNSSEVLQELGRIRPDFIFNACSQIIGEEVLCAPKEGCVNCHGSRLPEMRGAATYFWARLSGKAKSHVTLHFMEKEIDSGRAILFEPFEIGRNDSVYAVHWKASVACGRAFGKLAGMLENGERIKPKPLGKKGSYFGLPSSKDVQKLRKSGFSLVRASDFWKFI